MFTPKLEVLPPAQRDLWPKLADLPDHFVLYGGTAVDLLALKLGVIQQRVEAKDYWDIHALLAAGLTLEQGLSALDALHPLTTNWMIALKTLVYFQGGDLESLSAAIRRDLEKAVSQVREVPAFAGAKLPIGSGIC